MNKKYKRYIERAIILIVTWLIARLITNLAVNLIYSLQPGWLIVLILILVDEALPPVSAFLIFCLKCYADAKADGEPDQIMGRDSESVQEDSVSGQILDSAACQLDSSPKQQQSLHFPDHTQDSPKAESTPAPITPNPPTNNPASDNISVCSDQETDLTAEWLSDPFFYIRDPDVLAHYIALDIETTGFSHENDRIIELAAIHYVYGTETERFHTYVNPQMPIPKHITRMTGIHQSDVNSAPLIDDIATAFRKFIKNYPLVGHNIIDFDWPFLSAHMMLGEPSLLIDTLDMSRSAFPLLPSHKLSNLNYWFDLDDGASHRADSDASAANALMWACLYPDKYEPLYQMAIRYGIPENKHTYEPIPKRHFQHIDTSEIKPTSECNAQTGFLFGKKVVFTGELTIPRNDAMQMAVDAGAILRTSVSSKTDILVVGMQDLSIVGPDGMSTKEEKAHELNASGKGHVRIINEEEFVSLLSTVPNSDTT